jgi:hypothetical protein
MGIIRSGTHATEFVCFCCQCLDYVASNVGITEWERKVGCSLIEVFRYLPEGTKESHKKSSRTVSVPAEIRTWNHRIPFFSVTARPATASVV